MTFHPPPDSDVLRLVDLTVEELHLYEALLLRPNSAPDELVAAGWSLADAERVLDAIERKGLATRSLEQPPRYRAASPDACLGPLVRERHSRVQSAHALVERLAGIRPRGDAAPQDGRAEVVSGRRSLLRAVERLYASAREEVLCLDRPPCIDELATPIEQKMPTLQRGVRCRTLVDADALAVPGRLAQLHVEIGLGEDVRIGSGVPIKALIVDRRAALVLLHAEHDAQTGLLLRPSWLFDTMHALFELLWNRSVPFGADEVHDRLEMEVRELVAVLSTGSKDKTAASQLGISPRTLERRVQEMYRHLHARSRFQAGWNAALRALAGGAGKKPPG